MGCPCNKNNNSFKEKLSTAKKENIAKQDNTIQITSQASINTNPKIEQPKIEPQQQLSQLITQNDQPTAIETLNKIEPKQEIIIPEEKNQPLDTTKITQQKYTNITPRELKNKLLEERLQRYLRIQAKREKIKRINIIKEKREKRAKQAEQEEINKRNINKS